MKFELIAQMLDGRREELNQPDFVGEGLETLAEAIEAASGALEYINANALRVEFIDIFCDGNPAHCGYVDDDGWHRDCDCEID